MKTAIEQHPHYQFIEHCWQVLLTQGSHTQLGQMEWTGLHMAAMFAEGEIREELQLLVKIEEALFAERVAKKRAAAIAGR